MAKAAKGGGDGGNGPRLTREQKQFLALVAGAVLLLTAALVLIVPPKAQGTLSQVGQCTSLQGQQRYYCVEAIANHTSNVSVCGYLSGIYEQQCVKALSPAKGNAVTCSSLDHNSSLYQQCIFDYAESSNNATACSKLSGSAGYNCVMNLSLSNGFSDSGICSDIGNSTYSQVCSSAYSFRSAAGRGDALYCGGLSSSYNLTETSALSLATQNSSAIETGYSYSLAPRNYCYYAMASLTGNAMLCADINQTYSGLCYTYVENSIAAKQQNYTYDFNVSSPSMVCNGQGPLNQSECLLAYYVVQALKSQSYTACNSLQQNASRDACIYEYAVATDNSTVCGYIPASANALVGSCESLIGNFTNVIKKDYNTTTTTIYNFTT
jgi:hypothetical protein